MTNDISRLTRRRRILLAVLSLAGAYACADRVAAPPPPASTPQLDLEASGVFVSTLWRPTDSGAAYLGGVTGTAEVRRVGADVRVTSSDARALGGAAPAPLADHDGSGVLSRLVTARTIDLPSRDGKRLSIRLVADPRGDGRPAMAAVISEDGRPVVISEYGYAREAKGWRVVRSRSTKLDEHGKATLVVDNDLSRVLGGAGRSARPDAVAVSSPDPELIGDDGETRCAAERLALAEATAAYVAALGGVAAASAATCTAAPPVCAAILLGAQAVLAGADIALGRAVANLDACLNPPKPPPPPPPITPVGGGGPPGPGYTQWCEYHNTYVDGALVESILIRCWWEYNGE